MEYCAQFICAHIFKPYQNVLDFRFSAQRAVFCFKTVLVNLVWK